MIMAASKDARTAHSLLEKKRTSDVLSIENANVDFASLMLSDPVQKGLTSTGFEKPSPIQLKAIPLGRCGLDLIVQAKSGTGKTCVFGVIALESVIVSSNSLQILILAPTREIAVQVQDVIQAIGCAMEGLKCHAFIGGTIFGQDRQNLKKCHIAVGSPGRIKQLIEYDVMKTDSVRLFILDEADKLLDDKFQASVNWIYHQLPENKQMLALSATYPETLAQQLTNYMRDPTFVRLNPRDLTLQGIKQFYKIVPGHQLPHKAFQIKADHLVDLLSQSSESLRCTLGEGWPVTFISGNQEQEDRMKAMAELKAYKCRILISTDLTARGIDAENVNLIINLDVPSDFKTYLHRIGRAGRFGTHGAAITLASEGSEVNLLQTVQKRSGSNIKVLPDPLPSNLLELTFQEVETEVLPPEIKNVKIDSGDMVELISSSKTTDSMIGDKHLENTNGHRTVVTTTDDEGTAKMENQMTEKSKTEGGERDEFVLQNEKHSQAESQQGSSFMYNEDEGDIYEDTDSVHERNPLWSMRNELQDWLVPMAIVQQVKETTRQPWKWQDVVRLFEDGKSGKDGGDIDSKPNAGRRLKSNSVGGNGKDEKCYFGRSVKSRSKVSEQGDIETEVLDRSLSSRHDEEEPHDRMSQEAGRAKAENIDESSSDGGLRHLEDSDILVEFRALRDLVEKFKNEEAGLEEQDQSQSLTGNDVVDQECLNSEKKSLKGYSDTLKWNGSSSIEVENETYDPEWHHGKERVQREGDKRHQCRNDQKRDDEGTLNNDAGRTDERSLSARRDVTGSSSFRKEDEIAYKRSRMMTNAGWQEVTNGACSKGITQTFNDRKPYEASSDEGLSKTRRSLRDDRNADDEVSVHQNASNNSNVNWFHSPAQRCTSSDNIWEYFKLVARTGTQKMPQWRKENCPEGDKEDIRSIRKERDSVVRKVKDDLESFAVGKHEDERAKNASSEESSESMEESHDYLTTDYFQEEDQFTGTDREAADLYDASDIDACLQYWNEVEAWELHNGGTLYKWWDGQSLYHPESFYSGDPYIWK